MEKKCLACGLPLVRKDGEQLYRFKIRKYCSRQCFGKRLKRCRGCDTELVVRRNWQENQVKRHQNICATCDRLRRKLHVEQWKIHNQGKTTADIFNGNLKRCPICKEDLPRIRQYWFLGLGNPDGLSGRCIEDQALLSGRNWAKRSGYQFNGDNVTANDLRILKAQGCYFKNSQCKGNLQLDHAHLSGNIRTYVCGFHNRNLIPLLEKMARDGLLVPSNGRYYDAIYNPPMKRMMEQEAATFTPQSTPDVVQENPEL